jgi:hypothetical protein
MRRDVAPAGCGRNNQGDDTILARGRDSEIARIADQHRNVEQHLVHAVPVALVRPAGLAQVFAMIRVEGEETAAQADAAVPGLHEVGDVDVSLLHLPGVARTERLGANRIERTRRLAFAPAPGEVLVHVHVVDEQEERPALSGAFEQTLRESVDAFPREPVGIDHEIEPVGEEAGADVERVRDHGDRLVAQLAEPTTEIREAAGVTGEDVELSLPGNAETARRNRLPTLASLGLALDTQARAVVAGVEPGQRRGDRRQRPARVAVCAVVDDGALGNLLETRHQRGGVAQRVVVAMRVGADEEHRCARLSLGTKRDARQGTRRVLASSAAAPAQLNRPRLRREVHFDQPRQVSQRVSNLLFGCEAGRARPEARVGARSDQIERDRAALSRRPEHDGNELEGAALPNLEGIARELAGVAMDLQIEQRNGRLALRVPR